MTVVIRLFVLHHILRTACTVLIDQSVAYFHCGISIPATQAIKSYSSSVLLDKRVLPGEARTNARERNECHVIISPVFRGLRLALLERRFVAMIEFITNVQMHACVSRRNNLSEGGSFVETARWKQDGLFVEHVPPWVCTASNFRNLMCL